MNVIFMQPAAAEFSECDQFSLWGNCECFVSGFDTEADFNSGQKRGAWGLSWTLFEQSHYVAPLHWLTSFENSNQGGIQPLSTAKLLKWPKIQTLSLSETRSLPVHCVLQLSHGLVLSLSANIKCYSSAHNLTWDPTHNQRIDGHKSDQRPPSPVDWVLSGIQLFQSS